MAHVIDTQELRALAERTGLTADCVCLRHDLKGWSGWPVGYHEDEFVFHGTLAKYSQEEATIDEHHPDQTHYWSVKAPIAPQFYPYNQSTVWLCRHCRRVYLRHNDDGAYHVERRIRLVQAELIVDAAHANDGRE
ncbi:hypothetical protein WG219_11925 [Ectopseudomonas mendocina]|uniref:HNH endonuclease n=1 Tax=Ectopseudomonas mendocina TaxID=300 RepID=A0ABZ2RAL2_ECTME